MDIEYIRGSGGNTEYYIPKELALLPYESSVCSIKVNIGGWISYRSIEKYFNNLRNKLGIDITTQIYYDKYILKISPNDRPKCKNCGREVKFIGLSVGYKSTCSDKCRYELLSKEISNIRSKEDSTSRTEALRRSLKSAWRNPNSGYNSSSFIRRKSESMLKCRADPHSTFNSHDFTNFPSKFKYDSNRFGSMNLDSSSEVYFVKLLE